MVNEADMDFRIPGPPHSVVKHAQSTSVRQLIQQIENHPNRHALQQNLRQNQSFNPFSPESKQLIRDVENIELCELLETEPKAQCKVCLSYWDIGIVYCTCGHFLRKRRRANQQFHGHRHGKKPGDKRILFGRPVEEEMQEKVFPRNP